MPGFKGSIDFAGRCIDGPPALFVEICPVVFPVTIADTDRARDILSESSGISARDAIHAAVMQNNDVESIASFDKGFDCITGIRRLRLLQ